MKLPRPLEEVLDVFGFAKRLETRTIRQSILFALARCNVAGWRLILRSGSILSRAWNGRTQAAFLIAGS